MSTRADVTLTIDGAAVGTLTGARLSTSLQTLPAAAEGAYAVARVVPGVLSWSVSGSTFVPAPTTGAQADAGQGALRLALLGLSTVAVVVTHADATQETGDALVTSWEVSAEVGGAVAGSFELAGTGALTDV